MPCPSCGRTSACEDCLAGKAKILEAAREGSPVLRVRLGHLALHGNSASLCGVRGLPLSAEPCSKLNVPPGSCLACQEALRIL